jgi:hypothetical protein
MNTTSNESNQISQLMKHLYYSPADIYWSRVSPFRYACLDKVLTTINISTILLETALVDSSLSVRGFPCEYCSSTTISRVVIAFRHLELNIWQQCYIILNKLGINKLHADGAKDQYIADA